MIHAGDFMMSFVGFCEFQHGQSKGKSSNAFLKILANYRFYMGRRMHSNVFSSGLPFLLCFINAKLRARERK
jgi:hypothetical protein